MSNIPRIRAPGLWVPGSVVLPEEFEAIDEIRPWMINADGGSTNAPTVQIELGGAGLRVSGPSRLDGITIGKTAATGTFTIVDRSTLVVEGGVFGGLIRIDTGAVPGRIDLDGANSELRCKTGTLIRVQSGGQLKVEAGGAADWYGAATWYTGASATIQTGVTWTFNAGSAVNCSGEFYFSSSTWPKLSPTRNWERHSLLIGVCTGTDTVTAVPSGATTPDSWKIVRGGSFDVIFAKETIDAADFTIIEFTNLPAGGTMTSATISCMGATGATITMTFPTYQFIRWDATAVTAMSALISDAHVLANWGTTQPTTIPITSNAVIDLRYRYGLVVHHCFGASIPEGATYYLDCSAVGTAGTIQL